MSIATQPMAHTQVRTTPGGVYRITGFLLIVQFVLMFVALAVLGRAINWPASLGLPADQVLPLISAQAGPVLLGYSAYFVSALLLAPIALLLYGLLRDGPGWATLLVAAGIGVLASFAKLLGIVRWLVLMPVLAEAYLANDASPVSREALRVVYTALNAYAGGVGETLGVALLSGLWTGLVSIVALRGRTLLPRWIGVLGLVAALLLLAGVARIYGVELGPILVLQGIVWQIWMLLLAIVLWRAQPRVQVAR